MAPSTTCCIIFLLFLIGAVFSGVTQDFAEKWSTRAYQRCKKAQKPSTRKGTCERLEDIVGDVIDTQGANMVSAIGSASLTEVLERADKKPFFNAGQNAFRRIVEKVIDEQLWKEDDITNAVKEAYVGWMLKVTTGDSSSLGIDALPEDFDVSKLQQALAQEDGTQVPGLAEALRDEL
eukprot:TRINITY_DN29537_c0_g1_i1.p1 TRINITY_DN29537_c0_g1~~TRINITY_DN29537_c0_g1_i1.p1  ORF type:complete len:178 (-),score=72.07 TRINITY_DN29537_c0_g1_i1:14-547(-)